MYYYLTNRNYLLCLLMQLTAIMCKVILEKHLHFIIAGGGKILQTKQETRYNNTNRKCKGL